MTIKQLSIFVENRSGSLLSILEMLRDNGIGLGLALCGLQQAFGFVKMGDSSGTFIVNN